MRLAIDTNRYTDLTTGVSEVVHEVESAAEVYVPFAVLAELRAGFAVGTRQAANERALGAFLAKPFVRAVYPDEKTTACYATLYSDLRRRGRMVPTNDLWIAALCVQHALTLYTRDGHFDDLPQLARV